MSQSRPHYITVSYKSFCKEITADFKSFIMLKELKVQAAASICTTTCVFISTKLYVLFVFYLQVTSSNATQVLIRNVGFGLSGNFTCEVTADAPLFSTATAVGTMQVVGKLQICYQCLSGIWKTVINRNTTLEPRNLKSTGILLVVLNTLIKHSCLYSHI